MNKVKYKKYHNTTLWQEEGYDDIVCWNYSPNTEMDITLAKELVRDRLEYSEGKPVYALIDTSNLKSVTKEARDFMNSPEGGLKGIIAGAFLSNSIATNVLVNLYLLINRPEVPAKFFTKKADALNWLKELKISRTISNSSNEN